MLDTLNAIKNNNDTKVTNYDPSLTEHFRKLLRASVKSKVSYSFRAVFLVASSFRCSD